MGLPGPSRLFLSSRSLDTQPLEGPPFPSPHSFCVITLGDLGQADLKVLGSPKG